MTRPVANATGAIERELLQASGIVRVLLSLESREPPEDASDQFEKLAWPAALLDADRAVRANAAWRDAFGDGLPGWAQPGIETVIRAAATIHLPIVESKTRGHTVWFAATMTPLAGERAVVVCAQLDDATLARELTKRSEHLVWSGTLESGPTADYFSASWLAYAGEGDTAPSGVSAIHEEDREPWITAFTQAARSRTPAELEIRLRARDGHYRWHRVRIAFPPDSPRWFATAVDDHELLVLRSEHADLVERLRGARADAEHANRLKDQALAAVSHELRAPVTTMMLWERVLRDPTADVGARLQALDAIHQSAVAQSRLVADLLDVSRATSGKLFLDIRPVEIERVVGDAVESALPSALAKRITLTHSGTPAVGEVLGDAPRLRQVFDNVLSNAIKFTDPGGRVDVTTQRKGGFVVIKFQDTGRGIAPALLERIFEPFDQGEDAIARREGGLGLGLAIARQIAELHHGTLTAWSSGPGRGARFTLMLPAAGQLRAPAPPPGIMRTRALKAVRVLVVDDDERVRNALALLLDRAGAIVARAECATTAREQLAAADPEVLICDIGMPDENGYEFMRQVRASGNKIPAIALTAYASRIDADNALAAGFDLHIAKPVDFERLVASLSQLIDTRRS